MLAVIVVALLLALLAYLLYNRKQLQNKRKRDAELLQQQELRSRAAIEAEERERVRIARELHDGIGQQLSAAKLTLSGLSSLVLKDNPQQEELFQNATQLIDDAVKEVRSVSHSMMANALIKAGLAGAVRDFVQKVSASGSLKVDLEIVELNERLDPTIETVLFRVLQEVVNNIIRHAQASVISIQLIRHDDELVLVVEDNGIGFNVSKHKESEGIGLRNIRSRVDFLNGNLNIDSYPGKGTTITVEIPLK
jgi:signal transduction histidine kinase